MATAVQEGDQGIKDEIDRKLKDVSEAKAQIKESLENAQAAQQLVLQGFHVDPEVSTTFRGSIKLTGIPSLEQHANEDIRFEGYGRVAEMRVKTKDGVWQLQQVIIPAHVEVFDKKGKPFARKTRQP